MNCIFCKIIQKDIPATIVFENSQLLAIRDLQPQAPTHLLILPKKHIHTIDDSVNEDALLLGQMILCAKQIAQDEKINKDGYRLVFNVNSGGGQEVYHIHLHLLGGRQMTWPPG